MIMGTVMLPHPPIALAEIGHGEQKKIQATLDAYDEAARQIAAWAPDLLIVASPHATLYRDYFNLSSGEKAVGDFSAFGAGHVSFEETYDSEFTAALSSRLALAGFPGGTAYDRDRLLDHGTMVPLYFIRKRWPHYRLVRIGLSGLPLTMHYQLGMYIRQTADDLGRRAVFVASGDLSHCQKEDGPYGYRPEGPAYDERIMKDMGNADFGNLLRYDSTLLEKAMECGHRSFVMMAGVLDGMAVKARVLSHESPFGVGYGCVLFSPEGPAADRHFMASYKKEEKERHLAGLKKADAYVRLAADALDKWVREQKKIILPNDLPEAMLTSRAGVFVSLHEDGELRGCIGTILPVRENVAAEIVANAISAGTHDPRFAPVEEDELPYLTISVDVLGQPEPVVDRSVLDAHRYGVICTKGVRRGLLLPDLEGVDLPEQQIAIACRKAGIDPDEEGIQLERFEVVRHA